MRISLFNKASRIASDAPNRSERVVGGSGNSKPNLSKKFAEADEIFSRCLNLIIDNTNDLKFDVKEDIEGITPLASRGSSVTAEILEGKLNYRPNPFISARRFWVAALLDFLFEGNVFFEWDGYSLYNLPARYMTVEYSRKGAPTFTYNGSKTVTFSANQVIHIVDPAFSPNGSDLASGKSRVFTALNSLIRRDKLLAFKEKFFDNGAVFSLILETDAVLNKKARQRLEEETALDYNPRTGRSSVKVLDAGIKAKSITPTTSADLDISVDLDGFKQGICNALGVPVALLNGDNNSNTKANIASLFYLTILPIVGYMNEELKNFFAKDIKVVTADVIALRADAKEEAAAITSKVNNGLITGNEGRKELRMKPLDDPEMDKIRIPANIAGSGTGVSGQEGGRPPAGEKE